MKTVLLILGLLICELTFSQTNWTVVDSGSSSALKDVQFTSDSVGFIVGGNGTLLKTMDGGSTWSVIMMNTTEDFISVSFISDTVGYVASQNSIYKTTDGGISWLIVTTDLVNTFNTLKFITEDIGFIGTDSYILKTIDGGQNWVNIQSTLSIINSISFPTATVGYFTGGASSGYVYKTTDQGNTVSTTVNAFNTIREEIQFLDATTGYLIGWYSPQVLKTVDGGVSWLTMGTDHVGGIAVRFLDEQTGYHIDQSGGTYKILGTNDGGLNWTTELTLSASNNVGLRKIANTATHVFAIGNSGAIYKKSVALSNSEFAIKNNVKIFPNPTRDFVTVVAINGAGPFSDYVLYSLLGQEVEKGKIINNKIDLKNTADGAYLLKIGGENQTFKIIKKQ